MNRISGVVCSTDSKIQLCYFIIHLMVFSYISYYLVIYLDVRVSRDIHYLLTFDFIS